MTTSTKHPDPHENLSATDRIRFLQQLLPCPARLSSTTAATTGVTAATDRGARIIRKSIYSKGIGAVALPRAFRPQNHTVVAFISASTRLKTKLAIDEH